MTGNDSLLLESLAAGRSIVAAGAEAGMSESTARRRVREPGFVTLLDERRTQMAAVRAAQLEGHDDAATTKLREVMDDPQTPASVVVKAAIALHDFSAGATLLRDLVRRVSELEGLLETQGVRRIA